MIRNIFFDLGGIFVDLDQSATMRELARLGFTELTPEIQELFNSYECGFIDTVTFLARASALSGNDNRQELIDAWNAIIVGFPLERLRFLERLKNKNEHRLFLISNTNALHLERVSSLVGEENFMDFESAFVKCYYSHEVGLAKPDAQFFLLILEENKLLAEETLFIDDTAGHIMAAKKLGLQTWHLIPGKEEIMELETKLAHVRPGT